MHRKNIAIVSVLFVGLLFLMVSCQDTPSSFIDRPPELPPAESMEMDFSTFEKEGAQYDSTDTNTNAETTAAVDDSLANFAHAAFRAFIMKAVVDVNLAAPRILLKAAENTGPELNDKEEWVWSFSKSAQDTVFEARLVASHDGGSGVHWSMYVTNTEQNLDNRLFFEGTTTRNGREGTWTYYNLQGSDSSEAVSEVTWNIIDKQNEQLRLEVLTDRNGHQGDYIEYIFDGTYKTAVYYDAMEDATTEIEWNVDTHEGYLIAPGYNNGERSCWDSNLINTSCS